MKFKLGDFVRFVEERREGIITRIIDEQMVGVTDEDDFEVPVPVSKITHVYGQTKHEARGEDEPEKEKYIPAEEFRQKGVYLAVIPDQAKTSVVHFHLINETSFKLYATLTIEKQDKFKGEFAGIIASAGFFKVFTASLNELSLWPKLYFQILFFTPQNIPPVTPLLFEEKFKAKDFSGSKKQIPGSKQQGWLIRIDEDELKVDPEKLKESFFKPTEEKKTIEIPKKEIDLHIEKLRDDYQFLSNSEILRTQLEVFKKSVDAAIVHKLPTLIFIHGIGNGTLKNGIHKALGKHPQVKTFMDARKEKFGYGATEVIFK